jgi:hypothetical protein
VGPRSVEDKSSPVAVDAANDVTELFHGCLYHHTFGPGRTRVSLVLEKHLCLFVITRALPLHGDFTGRSHPVLHSSRKHLANARYSHHPFEQELKQFSLKVKGCILWVR